MPKSSFLIPTCQILFYVYIIDQNMLNCTLSLQYSWHMVLTSSSLIDTLIYVPDHIIPFMIPTRCVVFVIVIKS